MAEEDHIHASSRRLQRLRRLSRLLDSAIPLPGGYRIGLDGIIGLIPGVGDIAGGAASSYIIIEAARLGASTATLLRMAFNVLFESVIGLIPFIGDLFDFVWKANEKNLSLLEKQLQQGKARSKPEQRLRATVIIILLIMAAVLIALGAFSFWLLLQAIAAVHGPAG
ncbi:MAG TPA: DUF4112 domain-containing protein [Desulfopila sp.]|nr:DUF4112 domain-containing protein [Desulfopila sp.]